MPGALGCRCLVVSCSKLLCGGSCSDQRNPQILDRGSGFLLVLDAERGSYRKKLRLTELVTSLLSLGGEVWGLMDRVW